MIMDENLAAAIGLASIAICLFSFLSVRAWLNARQREREAYYRAEAIKKVAEMQGATPEPVLEVLREALRPPVAPAATTGPWDTRIREAALRSETLQKVAAMEGTGAATAMEMMREDERRRA